MYLISHTKMDSREIENLNVKCKTTQLTKENIEG